MARARLFHADLWDDSEFQELTVNAKLVFIYLSFNSQIKESGIIKITPRVISLYTGLNIEDIEGAYKELARSFIIQEKDLILIKGFFKRQSSLSRNHLKAVYNELRMVEQKTIKESFCKLNPEAYEIIKEIHQNDEGASKGLVSPPNKGKDNSKCKSNNKNKEKPKYIRIKNTEEVHEIYDIRYSSNGSITDLMFTADGVASQVTSDRFNFVSLFDKDMNEMEVY